MPEQDPKVTAERRDVVRAVVTLSERHDLPMPMDIQTVNGGVTLRLDDNDRDGVAAWAFILANPLITETLIEGGTPFISVRSEMFSYQGATWMGLRRVYIWSACDVPADVPGCGNSGAGGETAGTGRGVPATHPDDLPDGAPVVGRDPVTDVPLCEHSDDAAACQLKHRNTPDGGDFRA